VGVIWGEGMAVNGSSTTRGAGIRHRIKRFIRDLWQRLSVHARTEA
jgi:hypothetical protein